MIAVDVIYKAHYNIKNQQTACGNFVF